MDIDDDVATGDAVELWQDVAIVLDGDDANVPSGWATGRDASDAVLWSCAVNDSTYVAVSAARLYARYASMVPWGFGPPAAQARLRRVDVADGTTAAAPQDAADAPPLEVAPWEAWLNGVVAYLLRRLDRLKRG